MGCRYDLSSINLLPSKPVFFDANILIYIFWPTGFSPSWMQSYQKIFNNFLKCKKEMFVDFTVISEVINRAFKIEYENHLQVKQISNKQLAFKKYRDSSEGRAVLQDIYNTIKTKILNCFNVIGKTFTKSDIESFLFVQAIGFSDKAIGAVCKHANCILLTNDSDFSSMDIDILTSNPKLLKSR